MVILDCNLSFEQVNGKLDGYCRLEHPRKKNQGGRGDNHSHQKQHSSPSGVRYPMYYTHCFACLIFKYYYIYSSLHDLMKTIVYSASTKTPTKCTRVTSCLPTIYTAPCGIGEILAQVHSFLNGGICFLEDQPIFLIFPTIC